MQEMMLEHGRFDAGWWCADNEALCPRIWWCAPGGFVTSTLIGMSLWGGLFLAVAGLLYPTVESVVGRYPSKIKEENSASWFAWHVQSVIHASLVTWMAWAATWQLRGEPPRVQFDAPFHFEDPESNAAWAMIANGSHVFLCFLLVDTVVTFVRRQMTLDYFAHHCVFAFFTLLVQYHCFAGYLAGILLLMEISTIFLNGFSFLRNRLGYGHWAVRVFFLLFGVTFLLFRLVGTTAIAIYFSKVVLLREVPFAGIPRWHLYLICLSLLGAVGVQVFWAFTIIRKLVKVLSNPASAEGTRSQRQD